MDKFFSNKNHLLIGNFKLILFFVVLLLIPKSIANQIPKLRNKDNYIAYKLSLLTKDDLTTYLDNKLVLHYINLYSKCVELPKLIQRSKPYIQHILLELEKRRLPKELALLPIIESAYRIGAVSIKGATGIWQISYVAGKRYGLINTSSTNKEVRDDRLDIIASTNAALSYLSFLCNKFNNDWLLAVAAYNAGEGRISRAIQYNKINGKNTSYWTLKLPTETYHYVPKLLALAIIFNNPELYNISL